MEAGWANIFAVRGGTLFTPPPTAAYSPAPPEPPSWGWLQKNDIEAKEQPLQPDDLLNAEETFLTGSIRGIEPALSLNGEELPGCGDVSHRLAAALRRRWNLTVTRVLLQRPQPRRNSGQPAH